MANLDNRSRRVLITGLADGPAANEIIDAILAAGGGSSVHSIFGRQGDVLALPGDYAAAQVTNALSTLGSYADPVWLVALAGSKISGNIAGEASSITGTITESQVTGLVSDLSNKAPLFSPTFTGTPAAPMPLVSDNSTTIATTSYVKAQGYQTGNQAITLSGDVSGSGATAITTAIGTSKVTNAMLAGSIPASKLVQTDLTTVGVVTTGTWNATMIAVANGGTGATTAAAARTNLGVNSLPVPGKYQATSPASTTWTITPATHLLASDKSIHVTVMDDTTGVVVYPDIALGATGTVTITFAVAPTLNQYRVVLIG